MRISKTWIVIFAAALLLVILGIVREMKLWEPAPGELFGDVPEMKLTLELDPAAHRLSMQGTLRFLPAERDTFWFLLHSGLEIEQMRALDGLGRPLELLARGEELPAALERLSTRPDSVVSEHLSLFALPVAAADSGVEIQFAYSGVVHDAIETAGFSRWEIADETTGLIDARGAFLAPGTGFYPRLPGSASLTHYSLELRMPEEWLAISEGSTLEQSPGRAVFDSQYSLDGIHLIAGPYQRTAQQGDGYQVEMLHYPASADLTDRYLPASREYLELYDELIGPYPFERFSVVENFFPTGYGMPSFTLLGSQVLRLPFIVHTSLGHEVAHNWWGNGVLLSGEGGNWCEGLTTYCADYLYKLQQSDEAARNYRLDMLRDYSDYVVRGSSEDFALSQFSARSDAGSRAIGYGKAMMLFHMLERKLGKEPFWAALRSVYEKRLFKPTSWSDFFAEFETAHGSSLDSFQEQWVQRPGAPALEVAHVMMRPHAKGFEIEFDLRQTQPGESYQFDLPLTIEYGDEQDPTEHLLRNVGGEMYHARVLVQRLPETLKVDPDFHLFRVLDPVEAPATLAGFFGEREPLLSLQPGAEGREFGQRLLEGGDYEILEADSAGPLQRARLIIAATPNGHPALRSALGRLEQSNARLLDEGLALVAAWRSPEAPERVDLVVWGAAPEALMPIVRKLPHYGKYSYLAFSSGEIAERGHWKVERSPLIVPLATR